MSLYQLLKTQYKLKKSPKTIEITTKADFFEELFLTKKERGNNTLYFCLIYLIFNIQILITILITSFIFKDNFSNIASISVFIIILLFLVIISIPIYDFLKNKFLTKITKIKLKFYSEGLEITPDNSEREPIFIDSLNISGIYLKPKIEEREKLFKEYQPNDLNYLNIVLRLYKSNTNPLTKENIEELTLIEDIHKDYFREEAIKFIEEIKEALKI